MNYYLQVNGDDNDDHDGNVSTTIAVEQEKVVVEESVKEEQVSTPVAVVEQPKELPPQQPSSWAKIISNNSIPSTTSSLPTAPRVGNTTRQKTGVKYQKPPPVDTLQPLKYKTNHSF